ncbi:MAG: aminotransferase class I/II-fold pyridoxal phosphate-dependent enzyme, partial [Coriobacteriales bacterium]|nr:aminotransferase class I/II-fold pyridoxal phosphate-dependent enzyme [Coriobacteriales bacterium]
MSSRPAQHEPQAFDFDSVLDRRGTWSLKYDRAGRGKPEDVLPLWVADMDFAAPEAVQYALGCVLEHGIYGYSVPDERYYNSVQHWFETRHNWSPQPPRPVLTPGVVTAIYLAIRACTEPGDAVLIQQPVYRPFEGAVRDLERRLVVNELLQDAPGAAYRIDFEAFERQVRESQVRLFVLCSPHNPVGRVWRRDELERMGEICQRHGVIIFSDEIHQDLVFGEHHHTVFSSLNDELANISLIATSPSKTFNLAG